MKTFNDLIHQFYDKYYKTLFSYTNLLQEFFELFFPDLARHIDFTKAKKIDSTFITPEFLTREADIIYSVPIAGRKVYIYILIEHQSRPDPKIFLRFLQYQLSLWQRLIDEKNAKPIDLPPIIPVLIYNGQRKWDVPTEFRMCFKKVPKYIMSFNPNLKYLLFDLNKISNTFLLSGSELIKVPLYLDKNRTDVDQAIDVFMNRILKVRKDIDPELLRRLLNIGYYMAQYHSRRNPEQLEFDFNQYFEDEALRQEVSEMRKSAAAVLYERALEAGIEQGIERGVVQGIEQGQLKGELHRSMAVAKKLLSEGLDHGLIARATELSLEEIEKLASGIPKHV